MTRKWVSVAVLTAGAVLLLGTLGPIAISQVQYYLTDGAEVIDPTVNSAGVLDMVSFTDYTQISNWFDVPGDSQVMYEMPKVSSYTISIPIVKLEGVAVEVYGSDLKKSAVQYPGTALPGGWGKTVIFGHSTLPQLYKPSDPLSIFNPLPKVEEGDAVLVKYDGITYEYVVRDIKEVKPTQVEVLEQRYDRRELTLITCVPLGTYFRRLVVRAELVE